MYEVIKKYISKLVSYFKSASHKEVMTQEYEIIFQKIKAAKTLKQLLAAANDIEAYRVSVRNLDSPKWAVKLSSILAANWQRQYRLWKTRG